MTKPVLVAVLISVFAAFPSPSRCQLPFINSTLAANCTSKRYSCGRDIQNLVFPFWGDNTPYYCGHPGFELRCVTDEYALFESGGLDFRVLNVHQESHSMTLARNDLWESPCSATIVNTALNHSLFAYPTSAANLTLLYGCSDIEDEPLGYYTCPPENEHHRRVVYVNDSALRSAADELGECRGGIVRVPVSRDALNQIELGTVDLHGGLRRGFQVNYMDFTKCCQCTGSNGSCGFDRNAQFDCTCREGFDSGLCVRRPGRDWGTKAIIGVAGSVFGVAIMCALFYCFQWRKKRRESASALLSRNISSDISSSAKDVEMGGSTYLGIRVFTYKELADATNNFDRSKELGDGGFCTVYHGKLKDGRAVAVKRLYENNYRRVEQFMNEVEILAHVRHQNLVSLYGCTSRHSRELLLVYEYIPNGTVADHLHGARACPGGLPWPARVSIALDTAAALAYLHRSDIVHRDVKTNNILLDSHFRVKVADFGISRLFPTHVTHVSTAPQGTPGYVDPEYHQCYQLTSKSDVFSFGVVLVELISSMPAVDITRHRHDINLSTMAVSRIQNHTLHELVDPSLGFANDPRVRRAVTAVAELAFRCLQQEKDMRPSMDDVLEELKAIQGRDYDAAENARDGSADDAAVLLKNGPLTMSSDSVTISWDSSRTTTPNASK